MLGNYNTVALDIDESVIAIAEGKMKKDSIEVVNILSIDTPKGLVKDGEIVNLDELARLIKELLNANKIRGVNVNVALKYSKMIMKEVYIPEVNQKDFDDILKLVLYEELAINVDDFEIQYKIMAKKVIEEKIQYRVKVFILPKIIPEQYFKLVKKIGLRPKIMNLHTNNVVSLFNGKYQINQEAIDAHKTYCLVDLGKKALNLMMVQKGEVKYHRNILYNENELDLEIAKELGIYLDDAEKIRMEYLKHKRENTELDENTQGIMDQLDYIIGSYSGTIAKEINDAINVFIRTNMENPVDKVYCYGINDDIDKIRSTIEELTGLQCQTIIEVDGLKIKSEEAVRKYISVIAAIGAR